MTSELNSMAACFCQDVLTQAVVDLLQSPSKDTTLPTSKFNVAQAGHGRVRKADFWPVYRGTFCLRCTGVAAWQGRTFPRYAGTGVIVA